MPGKEYRVFCDSGIRKDKIQSLFLIEDLMKRSALLLVTCHISLVKCGIFKRGSGLLATFQVATDNVNFPEACHVELLSDVEADATSYEQLFSVGHYRGHIGTLLTSPCDKSYQDHSVLLRWRFSRIQ